MERGGERLSEQRGEKGVAFLENANDSRTIRRCSAMHEPSDFFSSGPEQGASLTEKEPRQYRNGVLSCRDFEKQGGEKRNRGRKKKNERGRRGRDPNALKTCNY